METAILAGGAILIATLLIVFYRSTDRRNASDDYPYRQHRALFTPAERRFYDALTAALGDRYQIFGKVRLADVVTADPNISRRARQQALSRIQNAHVDFVLCQRDTLVVEAVVFLDDEQRDRAKRGQTAQLLDRATAAANLPLLRFSVQTDYSDDEIRDAVTQALRAGSRPTPAPAPDVNPLHSSLEADENAGKRRRKARRRRYSA